MELMNLIKAVTFDLWNTLFADRNFTDHRVNYVEEFLSKNGVPRSHREIRQAYMSSMEHAKRVLETENHRHLTNVERMDHIMRQMGVELRDEGKKELIEKFEAAIWENPPSLKEGAVVTLEALKPVYSMGVISDTGITPGRVVREMLNELGILDFFGSTVFSDEVGFCKPHESMFRTALRELKTSPHEAVHVGDLLETDVAGAKAFGMSAIWVKTVEPRIPGIWVPDYEVTALPQVIRILDEMSSG
jgi:putative hydrolase of the HAD superfamily